MSALTTFCAKHGLNTESLPALTKTASRLDLVRLFAAMGFTRGVEVGTWTGQFAKQLCEHIKGLRLTCVDPWRAYDAYAAERKNDQERLDAAYREASIRLSPFGCELLRMTSLEAARQIPDGSLDFAYIDGNHTREFVEDDLKAWVPKVRTGGIIAGHDYELTHKSSWIQVKDAVDGYTLAHHIRPWYVLALEKAPSYFWVQA